MSGIELRIAALEEALARTQDRLSTAEAALSVLRPQPLSAHSLQSSIELVLDGIRDYLNFYTPASAAAERQSHADGPSAQAASGGHPSQDPVREQRAAAAIARREAQIRTALAELGEPDGCGGVNIFSDEFMAEARRFRVPVRKRETGSAPAAPAEIPPGDATHGPNAESPTAVDTQAPRPCGPGCTSAPAQPPLPQ